MITGHKNQGSYITYKMTGSRLSFKDGQLTVDLAEQQRDYPVHLDISEGENGKLVTGPAWRYLAEIDIPARADKITAGEKDDLGFPLLYKNAAPLDMDGVTLTLWAVEV